MFYLSLISLNHIPRIEYSKKCYVIKSSKLESYRQEKNNEANYYFSFLNCYKLSDIKENSS